SSPQIIIQPDLIANNMDPRIAHTFGVPGDGPMVAGTTFKYDPNRPFTEGYARVPGIYGHFLGMKDQELPECPCFRQYQAFFMTARNTDQIRWAEVLLWKAEALIELGRQDEALPLINQIRRRAAASTGLINRADGSPTGTWVIGEYTTMGSQDEARQILRKERRLELAFESKRFFDLVRWGITEEVIDAFFEIEKVRAPHLIDGNFTSGRDEYLAIPEQQITLSQGLYVQNPGYN
ncbi:MAG: RagB/SusD family nutrient uptake outer membrane protein, partial [Saprospiraceae bacterium]|nr:RagB/SusD family nutrient uptake outer membrane protein [Saprospiraceae bacterium]